MSRRSNHGKSHKVDLKLNLAPPMREDTSRRAAIVVDSPRGSSSSSSCLSSETEQGLPCQTSPEATSMVLAACPRCLMYVMLPEEDPKCCPKMKEFNKSGGLSQSLKMSGGLSQDSSCELHGPNLPNPFKFILHTKASAGNLERESHLITSDLTKSN
ncbi:hypothetical protein BHE74_00051017 [Ensete ventricosum]|uniref:Runt domain-containing protein n=1 Tax=Ensete ventricosum TaxID=4639 RepID=A0A445MMB5_ENSVE|nr:hypothetical protein BHE74_00051017 [Ensete ventricosum]RZR75379.1 hypothetical protein BHM03_00056057 [Ensete ventricosum]